MSNPIPGDWIVSTHGGMTYIESVSNGNVSVCRVSAHNQIAHAQLIAAAPDMLEALIACDEAMAYMSEYDIPITLPDKVKAAIKKAQVGL